MSVANSLHQEHKARLRRIAARAVPQADAEAAPRIAVAFSGTVDRTRGVRSRDLVDRDYERAWAAEIMGLVEDGKQPRRRPRIVEIQRATAQYFGITVADMIDDQQRRKLAMPRHAAMYLAKQLTLKSFAEIGRAFAGRDHSTVVHAVNGIVARLPVDGELAHHIEHIRDELEGGGPLLSEDNKQG
jgi:chromosomal replication initiation ATPase DnaA